MNIEKLDKYLDVFYNNGVKTIDIKELEHLPIRIDGKDATRATEQFLILYKDSNEIAIIKEAISLCECFEPKSLIKFADSVLEYWMRRYDSKSKWLLLIPIIHGDYKVVQKIKKLIDSLALGSMQQLCVYIIKALGLNGSREAFVTIGNIGTKTKYKSLRTASEEAFEIASEQLGISKGELGDHLVEDMGFIDGYIPLAYGDEIYKLYLENDLMFIIQKPDGKRVKTLPKLKEKEEFYAEVNEAFKALKKQLKDMVSLQTSRLHEAMQIHRLWSGSRFKELFLQNVIMNTLASNLIWGIYEENKLIKSFSLCEESIELEDNCKVGIAHSLELTKDEISSYKDLFAKNKQENLFAQLDKEIVSVDDEEKLEFKPSYNRKNPSTFVGRLRKKGWHIGSVRDGGTFDELYKEIKELDLGVELTFEYAPWMGEYTDVYEVDTEDRCIGIEKIEFYHLGTIKRGQYIYDELEEHDGLRYMPKEINKRVISELLLEIKDALK